MAADVGGVRGLPGDRNQVEWHLNINAQRRHNEFTLHRCALTRLEAASALCLSC